MLKVHKNDTEDSDPSSTDTGEATLSSAPPMDEADAKLEEMIAGLRRRALQQGQWYVAVLARMRKDLKASAWTRMLRELGWHLGPAHETVGASRESNKPEPTWLLDRTRWIMNRLATIREQKQQAWEEQFRAMQEILAMMDDGLDDAEEHLAKKREAELQAQAKEMWRLPVITAQLGLLWHQVTGAGRPHTFGNAADNDRERDDNRRACGNRRDPPAVRGGAPTAVGEIPSGCRGASEAGKNSPGRAEASRADRSEPG
jgi:hypothetical protein